MSEIPSSLINMFKSEYSVNIKNDVSVITYLSNTIWSNYSQLTIYTKVWLEFALSISNEAGTDIQHYEHNDFCNLISQALDPTVFDIEYILKLKCLAKKSGRLVEFATLLNHLCHYNYGNYWLINDMAFQVCFHALQLNQDKFSHKDLKLFCTLLEYKLCFITSKQFEKLASLAYLNNRLRCYKLLNLYSALLFKDLCILEPYYKEGNGVMAKNVQQSQSSTLNESIFQSSDDAPMICDELSP
ncbi:MAG: hypothetical protein VX835_04105 [Pseudomonadota bacterium]|nr:hypothetical protein [Pseudomonadota bacterium]